MESGALTRSAIIVHYHTPELAARAVAALRADGGSELEIILVDNGSDAAGRERLESLDAAYLAAGRNRGYAGGVNLGMEAARGDLVLLLNPDVEVCPGCTEALFRSLESGAAAAGPRLWWDGERTFQLPPTELRRPTDELRAVLARHGGRWAREVRAAWRRHARRFWTADRAFTAYELSGAILALHREAWNQIGPFDEGYRLYFEETDWLERARQAGLIARYVPAAEATHGYAQSTVHEPRAERWFAASADRFRRQWYGDRFVELLERTHRQLAERQPPPKSDRTLDDERLPTAGELWLEVSSSRLGFPAAGRRFDVADLGGSLDRAFLLPAAMATADVDLWLRLVDAAGTEIAHRAH